MTESVSLSAPVKVQPGTDAAVAFELMKFLKSLGSPSDKNDVHYWLTLYRQCYKATHGHQLESILRED